MALQQFRQWLSLTGALCLLLLFYASTADAAGRSSLSRWLSGTAVPEFIDLANNHPRLDDSTVQLRPSGSNALEEAIATVVNQRAGDRPFVVASVADWPVSSARQVSASIDELDCSARPGHDYELRIAVRLLDQRHSEVRLALHDAQEAGAALQVWRWRGRLTGDEYRYAKDAPVTATRGGTLQFPWTAGDAEQAAEQLARQLVCGLRPAIDEHVRLAWATSGAGGFTPVIHALRGRLAGYRELSDSGDTGDVRLEVQLQPVQSGVWQLWLTGSSGDDRYPPVQAVTYVSGSNQVADALSAPKAPAIPANLPQPLRGEPASNYLSVDLLEASQSDRQFNGADLRVRLRLKNRAARPLEYALSLSGGHYQHCIAEPAYYRHDRYGYLQGRLEPGQSVVRVMEIEGARHNPNPWFGMRRCAGFMGLDGFEEFKHRGHKVTQFVRWSL